MNDKWLVKEGKEWVKEGIITEEQYNKILSKYPDSHSKRGTGLLPVFASILIGLGILSFIASNWDGISPPFRLVLLIAVLIAFYTVGHNRLERGNPALGRGLITLGIVSFGAGIILIGQTFHFVSYDARTFVIWSIPALLYLYLLRGKLLFFVSFALLTGGQLYALSEFSSYSYMILILFAIGLGCFVYTSKEKLLTWFFAGGLVLHLFFYALTLEDHWVWLVVILVGLYTAAEGLKENLASPLRFFTAAAAFITSLILYFTLTNTSSSLDYPDPVWFGIIFVLLFAAAFFIKMKSGTLTSFLKMGVLLVPWFYLSPFIGEFSAGIIYLIASFLFSGFVLSEGYQKEERSLINWGIILFLLVTFIAYINLAWSFMPKSLFFLIGGILLLALYFFLQKKKRNVLEEGGDSHEEK
ncbi:DUF2157 domain-containing protein [Fictibacillus terranigra]|uniref:DUF2157 domain-containing protein n=1 Tax=Fictibacillus terranigra TaxID=3058424 RepID=A0ABT8ECX4_9BACL|nr:DUF2157 domain-containing protein [Fictibacillus sp. CENA-BCM004]MDN4075768.1 DUF2157 domain-containing protein [Fictibacillus sp. CENA-BCM004]